MRSVQQGNGNLIELKVLNNVFKDVKIKDKKGQVINTIKKCVARGVVTKRMFDKSHIRPFEVLSKEAKLFKTKTLIFDLESQDIYVIKSSYEDLVNKTKIEAKPRITVKGFYNG